MKKISDIKIGILIGLVLSSGILLINNINTHFAIAGVTDKVHNATTTATDWVSSGLGWVGGKNKRITFSDVFGKSFAKNIYALVYSKALVEPEMEALKTLATSYGFTIEEAKSVYEGSIEPIVRKYGDSLKTHQDVFNMASNFRETFVELYEMLQLEQELTLGAVASEIFSNGDVIDSGFDLVKDLDIIEEIIFGTTTKGTLGGPIDFGRLSNKENTTDELLSSEETTFTPVMRTWI